MLSSVFTFILIKELTMKRTQVRSINKAADSFHVSSCTLGVHSRALRVDRVLRLSLFPKVKVGDIMRCDGSPYLTAGGAHSNMHPSSCLNHVCKVGEEGWVMRSNKQLS